MMLNVREVRAMASRGSSELPLLSRLEPADTRSLAQIARRRRFAAGETVFTAGDGADALYIVTEGRFGLFARAAAGQEALVRSVRTGDSFGDLGILAGTPHTLTAIALEASAAVAIDSEQLEDWLLTRQAAALAMLQVLSLRLQRMTDTVADLLVADLPHRVAKLLLMLAANRPREDGGGRRIAMTQAEIGLRLGVSRESVNKVLQAFARDGWLTLSRGAVLIRQELALHAFVDGAAALHADGGGG